MLEAGASDRARGKLSWVTRVCLSLQDLYTTVSTAIRGSSPESRAGGSQYQGQPALCLAPCLGLRPRPQLIAASVSCQMKPSSTYSVGACRHLWGKRLRWRDHRWQGFCVVRRQFSFLLGYGRHPDCWWRPIVHAADIVRFPIGKCRDCPFFRARNEGTNRSVLTAVLAGLVRALPGRVQVSGQELGDLTTELLQRTV